MFNIFRNNKEDNKDKPKAIGEEMEELTEVEEKPKQQEEKEKWFWVEGYKGFNEDLTCLGLQYYIGKPTKSEGELELCANGLHFSFNIEEVFNYYVLKPEHRFFKIKALININQLYFKDTKIFIRGDGTPARHMPSRLYGTNQDGEIYCNTDKAVAKEIVLVEELQPEQELEPHILLKYPDIDIAQDYKIGFNYKEFLKNNFIKVLTDTIMPKQEMAEFIAYKISNQIEEAALYHKQQVSFGSWSGENKYMQDAYKQYISILESDTSNDMKAYLFYQKFWS